MTKISDIALEVLIETENNAFALSAYTELKSLRAALKDAEETFRWMRDVIRDCPGCNCPEYAREELTKIDKILNGTTNNETKEIK